MNNNNTTQKQYPLPTKNQGTKTEKKRAKQGAQKMVLFSTRSNDRKINLMEMNFGGKSYASKFNMLDKETKKRSYVDVHHMVVEVVFSQTTVEDML